MAALQLSHTIHRIPLRQQMKVTICGPVGLKVSASSAADYQQLIKIRTLSGSKIRFSKFCFDFDGEGGEGIAYSTTTTATTSSSSLNGSVPISFDVNTVSFPPLTSNTAVELFGFPFPPLATLQIFPDLLQGSINTESGQVDLEFRGKLRFNVGTYKARPLSVEIMLTSEESKGKTFRTRRGERIGRDGSCRLIGVTALDPFEGDQAMNSVLGLPTECQIELRNIIPLTPTILV